MGDDFVILQISVAIIGIAMGGVYKYMKRKN